MKISKRRKRQVAGPTTPKVHILEYYQPGFALLHADLGRTGYDIKPPHEVCNSFWKVVPPGTYTPDSARPLVAQYQAIAEKRLAQILSNHCIGYWLHAYRRLFPGSAGPNESPTTNVLVRATLDAAIQKYGQDDPCNGVGISTEVRIEEVLGGLLLGPEWKTIREHLMRESQLVLTSFSTAELRELYECEKLAYQIWRCGAALRILGKGAPLIVDPTVDAGFYDGRWDELDRLVANYDERDRTWGVSATGTVFPQGQDGWKGSGAVLLPVHNVGGIHANELNEMFRLFHLELWTEFKPNFVWLPYNLRGYYAAHEPFAEAFQKKHGLPLDWIIAVIGALCSKVLYVWGKKRERLVYYWQRAYSGPAKKELVLDEVRTFLPMSIDNLRLGLKPGEIDVSAVASFLELGKEKRANIDLMLGGPTSVFLPYGKQRWFVDYAWILRLLYNLFYDVELADQNFKGEALEKLVRAGRSVLPAGPCKALDDESKQIDAAFALGDTLLIIECRATGRSFGIDRGDPRAIEFRVQRVEKALRDIDEKGKWLAAKSVGRNYDIRKFRRILPIAISSFVEFIGSRDAHYWLTEDLPRVLTPHELKKGLADGTLEKIAIQSSNTIPIQGG